MGLDLDVDVRLVARDRLQGFLNTLHILRQLCHLPLREGLLSLDISYCSA